MTDAGRQAELWSRLHHLLPPNKWAAIWGAGEPAGRMLRAVGATPDPIVLCVIDPKPRAAELLGNPVRAPRKAPLDWIGAIVVPPGPEQERQAQEARRLIGRRPIRLMEMGAGGWGHGDPDIAQKLHIPLEAGSERLVCRAARRRTPLPPPELVGSYRARDYLSVGAGAAGNIRRLLRDHGVELRGRVLDWGCQAGRVMRHFAPEARRSEFWGCDVYADGIRWCKENLSPPFRFVTTTFVPHLPFTDGYFDFVYATSVYTHISDLIDTWLMEHRRILRPGGHAVFSILDENTWGLMRRGKADSIVKNCRLTRGELGRGLGADLRVYFRGRRSVVFHHTSEIRREWGRYFEVAEIRPESMGNQSFVLLRRPHDSPQGPRDSGR